jgi:hypothetical protein
MLSTHYTQDSVSNATHTGDVTGSVALTIALNAVRKDGSDGIQYHKRK